MKIRLMVLFVTLAGLSAQAQVNYAISGNTAYVTNSPNASGNIVIASTYGGYPVTSIGFSAFGECYSLTNVTIPNSVTSIGQSAFAFCTSLTNVTIPDSVTNIGYAPFADCVSLTNIAVAVDNPAYSSVNGVLFDKTQTTLIQFPGGLGGSYAISNSVTSIWSYAFFYCPSLTSVILPNSVTSIGDDAFNECTSLTNLAFLGNAPALGSNVFDLVPGMVYYYYGTSGWGTSFGGAFDAPVDVANGILPTVGLFSPPQISSGSIGVQAGIVGFTLTGVSGQTVMVEASTNLVDWQPVWTTTLSGTSTNFTDAQWTNFLTRFYRAACAYTVGGSLTGLPAGDTVTLQDNGSDNLTLSTNGTFTFPTALPNGHAYSISVSETTGLITCTLTNGSGTISGANVTNVAAQCRPSPTCPALTGNKDLDMYNAAVADGTANGGAPGVMLTQNGGPFRVTAAGRCSRNVAEIYSGWAVVTQVVGTYSCSSTTLPTNVDVIQFGTVLACGFGPYGY